MGQRDGSKWCSQHTLQTIEDVSHRHAACAPIPQNCSSASNVSRSPRLFFSFLQQLVSQLTVQLLRPLSFPFARALRAYTHTHRATHIRLPTTLDSYYCPTS